MQRFFVAIKPWFLSCRQTGAVTGSFILSQWASLSGFGQKPGIIENYQEFRCAYIGVTFGVRCKLDVSDCPTKKHISHSNIAALYAKTPRKSSNIIAEFCPCSMCYNKGVSKRSHTIIYPFPYFSFSRTSAISASIQIDCRSISCGQNA